MLYSKLLDTFFTLPSFLRFVLFALLVVYILYFVYSIRKDNNCIDDFISVNNFAPIALILLMHIIEKAIYFIFSIRLENMDNFFLICVFILMLGFLGKKHGPLGVVSTILFPFVVLFFLHFFFYFTSVVLAIISTVVLLTKVKKCKAKRFPYYLFWISVILAWFLLQFIFGMMNAFEIVLFAISLWYSLQKHGVKGCLQWMVHLLLGLLFFFLIDLSFAHIITVIVLYEVFFNLFPQIL